MSEPKASEGVLRRFTPAASAAMRLERRAAGEDGKREARIVGYVARFNVWSPVYYDFRERIAPGFFDGVLGADVRGLFNHSADWVLGRTTSGTLALSVDADGLRMDCLPPQSGAVWDVGVAPLERGDVTGASFSFLLPPEGGCTWERGGDGVWERTLLRCAELYDVGPVTFPWYPETELGLERALEERARMTGERGGAPPAVQGAGGLSPDLLARSLKVWEMRVP